MTKLDKRPVYKNKKIEKAFKNAEYYFVKYVTDCPICLNYFENPQVLPCGHCYCRLCISVCVEYTNNCPMCAEFFWIYKPAQFFFTQEIEDHVLFRKCCTADVSNSESINFYEQPFSLEYFEESLLGEVELVSTSKKSDNSVFYQSNDGQLYFLDPKITYKMATKPLYLYSKIKEKYECYTNYEKYPELAHIPPGTKIVILKV